jgi:DCN1-like protein 1/2
VAEPEAMDVEGMMKYLGDLEVDLETAQYLIPLEIVQAPAFGEITKQGFIDGWKALK